MNKVIIHGAKDIIKGIYEHSTKSHPSLVLIINPHPKHGGNMNNRIIQRLFKSFASNNFSTLIFNFCEHIPPINKLTQNENEIRFQEADSALTWLRKQNNKSNECWVCGLSYGSWLGMQLMMRRPEIKAFISLSPPVDKYDFSFLAPCPAPGIVVYADKDRFVSEQSIAALRKKVNMQKGVRIKYKKMLSTDHFFSNCHDKVINTVEEFTKDTLKERKHLAMQQPIITKKRRMTKKQHKVA